jgi:pyridoxal phosphate enzyme (YggS family)
VFDSVALRARFAGVRDRIARAADRAGRDPASVRLIAVSKTFDADYVRALADCGQTDFGENKVQEAQAKVAQTADLRLVWHLVGHLQSNKVRKAAACFDVVQSIDGAALVQDLDAACAGAGRTLEWLAQVDLAGEATKHGAREKELPAIFEAARRCRATEAVGLMLLPPAADEPEQARPYFRALRAVREQLVAQGVAASAVKELSMGMSHDFEVAIEEGATLVRVGTAIFGARTYA